MICFKCDRCGEVFDGYKVDGFNGIAKIKTEKNRANLIADEEPIQLCPSCMKELNDWLEPNKEKLDNGNKNKWNNMTTQPQSGIEVEIKLDSGEQDIAYRRYGDKRWFLCDNDYVLHNESIVAWRYID